MSRRKPPSPTPAQRARRYDSALRLAEVDTGGEADEVRVSDALPEHLDRDARYLLAPWPDTSRTCPHEATDAAPLDHATHLAGDDYGCPWCYGEQIAEATRAGLTHPATMWGTITLDADDDRPDEVASALVDADDADEDLAGTSPSANRPGVLDAAPGRLRQVLERVDALAGSDPASPWHDAALVLRRRGVEGPTGLAILATEALEALVAHAEYRRAYTRRAS